MAMMAGIAVDREKALQSAQQVVAAGGK